jgi:small subunit ribosomal protein S8
MYTRLLTELKNAQDVGKERYKAPHAAFDEAILNVLSAHHFIAGFERKGKNPKRYFDIALAYKNGKGAVKGIKIASTSGRRVYVPYAKIPSVKQGHGIVVLTTSKGVMDGSAARKEKIGGQILFTIW